MYSLFLIYTLVTFVGAASISEIILDEYNQCGCFRQENCPNLYMPKCVSGLTNYEDLYLQNSPSSKSPEVCSKWYLNGFLKRMTAAENGTLKITLYFSSHLANEVTFELQLRYQSHCSDSSTNSTFYLLGSSHSKQYITANLGTSNESCDKAIEVSFPYVFSGCYQLYINGRDSEISGGCMSKPFYVDSSYQKAPLNELKVISYSRYNIERQELVYTSSFGKFPQGLNPYSAAVKLKSHIDLSLDDCAMSGNEAAKYVLVHRGDCCHAIEYISFVQPRNMSNCPCKWDGDGTTLVCKFEGIENGNYCVVIEFIDPRCEKSTLWTTKSLICAWGFLYRAVVQTALNETNEANEINETDKVKNHAVILSLLLATLGIIWTLFIVLYFYKRRKKNPVFTGGSIMEKSRFINEECEILLLYPRDCEEFMRAMTQFRILLKDSCLCKVHDAHDEEIFDIVADSIETWSLPLINNKNTKIIVVLNECSKIIEESYIDNKYSFSYRDPKAFDKVFGQSLKYLNEYFATRSDSYQRVFVVRLDEAPVYDLSFHFNCATVYIIPHVLETLISDLQNGNVIKMNKQNIATLETAIKEYQLFKQQHNNYLNEIVKVGNSNKIMKLLKN